jgi:hypothetical protein
MTCRGGKAILTRLLAGLMALAALLAPLGPTLPGLALGGLGPLAAAAAEPASLTRAAAPRGGAAPLLQRLESWPHWSLPAPLPRPGRRDLVWPAWFAGEWQVREAAEAEEEGAALQWRARFRADGRGGAVADRAFNARALGRAALGPSLLSVVDDPANPNRQLSRLVGDQLLETTVVGRRSLQLDPTGFLADELSLQVLHGPGAPRIQRVEVLGRWRLLADGGIEGEQWQASYGSPGAGLSAAAERPRHIRLRLSPVPPESDPAS